MLGGMNLAVFLAAALVLIITPGPDMLYVIARGIAQGRAAALIASLGIALGFLVHTLLAAFGLSVLLAQSLVAFMVVKYVGAAYLVYLGVRALLSREALLLPAGGLPVRPAVAFRQGFFSNVFNPKAALFVQAFLPQFVVPGQGDPAAQVLALGVLVFVPSLAFHALVSCGADSVGGWLRRRPALNSWLGWVTGGLFIGLGVRLALLERR